MSGIIRNILIIIAAAIAIALIAAGVYFLSAQAIKNNGVLLVPSKDIELHEITYYLQNDPEWAEDAIGRSNTRMGGAGCLISCVAGAITDVTGAPITPRELNASMTDVDGYEGADLIWYKLKEAVPAVDYRFSRLFTAKTIETDLGRGLLPIVRVRYRGGGVDHWLLVLGAQDGEFLIYDPLNRDKRPMALSVHGKVYAYRVIVPRGKEQG